MEPKCYGCGKTDNFAKYCRNGKLRNKAYFRRKKLLADIEENGKMLTTDEHDFLVDTDDEGELLETNLVFIAKIEKVDGFEVAVQEAYEGSPSYDTDVDVYADEAFINEVNYVTDNESASDFDSSIMVAQ